MIHNAIDEMISVLDPPVRTSSLPIHNGTDKSLGPQYNYCCSFCKKAHTLTRVIWVDEHGKERRGWDCKSCGKRSGKRVRRLASGANVSGSRVARNYTPSHIAKFKAVRFSQAPKAIQNWFDLIYTSKVSSAEIFVAAQHPQKQQNKLQVIVRNNIFLSVAECIKIRSDDDVSLVKRRLESLIDYFIVCRRVNAGVTAFAASKSSNIERDCFRKGRRWSDAFSSVNAVIERYDDAVEKLAFK